MKKQLYLEVIYKQKCFNGNEIVHSGLKQKQKTYLLINDPNYIERISHFIIILISNRIK